MPKITLSIDDLQPNQALVIMLKEEIEEYEYDDDPDPGEEIPEEKWQPHLMAIGGKRG